MKKTLRDYLLGVGHYRGHIKSEAFYVADYDRMFEEECTYETNEIIVKSYHRDNEFSLRTLNGTEIRCHVLLDRDADQSYVIVRTIKDGTKTQEFLKEKGFERIPETELDKYVGRELLEWM